MRAASIAAASCGLAGNSPAMTSLKSDIARVARFSSNILITGPSGTGKELVARQVHALSPRAAEPFIPVDCASMSGELMASQLFGHVAGAYTGANCSSLGCIRAAHGGTLFLDEVGELEYTLQAKLLRVLQERVVTPVGSHRGEPVDVRVVAATNRNLHREVQAGRFREDLYYRLHVVHLQTTPLRDRVEDIAELATTFLNRLHAEGWPQCRLSEEAARRLAAYSWPGNVRELRNVLEQATIDAEGPVIGAELIERLLHAGADAETAVAATTDGEATSPPTRPSWTTLVSIERAHILLTLEHTFYNRAAAARLLGITRQALLRKMIRHDIRPPEGR